MSSKSLSNEERLRKEGKLARGFKSLRAMGLSGSQAWEVLRESEPLDEFEILIMIKEKWSLHQVRQTTHDALVLKLCTCSEEYRKRIDAYLDEHGPFLEEEVE